MAANALQAFLQSVASGQQDVTQPFLRGASFARAGQQQQIENEMARRAMEERIRQFNLAQPARNMTAQARALSAQTGAGRLSSDVDWRAKWGERQDRMQGDAMARIDARHGIGKEKELAKVAGAKEAARQGQVTAGFKNRQDYKAKIAGNKSDPILRRQLINRIAQARHALTIVETRAGSSIVGDFGGARKAAMDELQQALRMFQEHTGTMPTAQELQSAEVGPPAPQQGVVAPPQDPDDLFIQNVLTSTGSR